MSIALFFGDVAELPVSKAISESLYLFSAFDVIHILGVLLLAGSITVLDLRLLGLVFNDVKLNVLQKQVLPIAIVGAVLLVPSGVGLFLPQAATIWENPLLQVKVLLLILAVINIAYWHYNHSRHQQWDGASILPWQARLAGGASLVLWTGTLIAGRLIAFYI